MIIECFFDQMPLRPIYFFRFFKLFPLINMHDGGLQRFAKYMNSKLASTSQQNLSAALSTVPGDPRYSVIFADTLTLLFEG
jgi:hypothetical protein